MVSESIVKLAGIALELAASSLAVVPSAQDATSNVTSNVVSAEGKASSVNEYWRGRSVVTSPSNAGIVLWKSSNMTVFLPVVVVVTFAFTIVSSGMKLPPKSSV